MSRHFYSLMLASLVFSCMTPVEFHPPQDCKFEDTLNNAFFETNPSLPKSDFWTATDRRPDVGHAFPDAFEFSEESHPGWVVKSSSCENGKVSGYGQAIWLDSCYYYVYNDAYHHEHCAEYIHYKGDFANGRMHGEGRLVVGGIERGGNRSRPGGIGRDRARRATEDLLHASEGGDRWNGWVESRAISFTGVFQEGSFLHGQIVIGENEHGWGERSSGRVSSVEKCIVEKIGQDACKGVLEDVIGDDIGALSCEAAIQMAKDRDVDPIRILMEYLASTASEASFGKYNDIFQILRCVQ